MATRRKPPRPRHLRLLEPLQPDTPPRRLSKAGVFVVTVIVAFALMALIASR